VSKYQFRESDIYLPGTDIPKNRLGISEADLLHEIEATLLQQAYQTFIAELQPATRFDEAYLKSLHQRTWASLYPLFVQSTRHLIKLRTLEPFITRTHHAAMSGGGVVRKFGIAGLFVFVFARFWMTARWWGRSSDV
jgi:fido (protein-threonine AMPylation protein)